MTIQRQAGGQRRGDVVDNNGYVTYLKNKVDALMSEVRTLKSRIAHSGGRRGSLKELRLTYKWTEDDINISKQVLKFTTEYLFPRFKFLEKGWIVHKPEQEGGMRFSVFVKKHLPLPDDVVFEEKWDTLIAPTIVKRYTDMRCNVNGVVREQYLRE
jgi:hypothetical protein